MAGDDAIVGAFMGCDMAFVNVVGCVVVCTGRSTTAGLLVIPADDAARDMDVGCATAVFPAPYPFDLGGRAGGVEESCAGGV